MPDKSLKKRQPQSDDRRPFINLSWTQVQEADFDSWLAAGDPSHGTMELIRRLVSDRYSFKVSPYEESWCATIENPDKRESGQAYLLSGWSDDWADALAVAFYKLYVLMEGDWNHPFVSPTKSRRR